MAQDILIKGPTTGTAGVAGTGSDQLKVITETNAIANPANVGDIAVFSEVDQGYITTSRVLYSPEADNDYRLRVSQDLLFDEEVFNYTIQNSGKHNYATATTTATWASSGLSITGSNSAVAGVLVKTYATFPNNGTQTLSFDAELAFSGQPVANAVYEFGFIGAATANLSAPTDGVFFRLTSAGLQGIASNNGTETSTGVFTGPNNTGTFTYTNAKNYQFIAYLTAVGAFFWINDGTGAVLMGNIPLPVGQSRIVKGTGLVVGFAARALGTATGSPSMTVGAYNVRLGGSNMTTTPAEQGNRIYGSYQFLSGSATMGSLQSYANSTNPTAAAPSNTSLTANLPSGFGGQGLVTAAAAAATDGIWCSAQVPAATVAVPGRRLKISAVYLDLVNTGAAVATTATTIQFRLAFGHTAVSLATTDGVATKSPRSVSLGIATWAVGAAVGQQPQAGPIKVTLTNPIFVNPGEFVALVGKFLVGTATASQTINFTLTYDMGWE